MITTEERMEALEKQVRRQRRWNIALGVVVVVGGLMAAKSIQEVPDVIQAKKFEVVNDQGKTVVHLNSTSTGTGVVDVCKEDGSLVVGLCAAPKEGGLGIWNDTGKQVVGIGLQDEGGLVSVSNKKGKSVIDLSTLAGEFGGILVLKNADDKPVVGLGETGPGMPMQINWANGEPGFLFQFVDDGPQMVIYNKHTFRSPGLVFGVNRTGGEIGVFGHAKIKENSGLSSLFATTKGGVRMGVGETGSGEFSILDNDGKVLFSAPETGTKSKTAP